MKKEHLIAEGKIAEGIYFLIKEKSLNPEKVYTMKDFNFIKCKGYFLETGPNQSCVFAFDNTGTELEQKEFDFFDDYNTNMQAAKAWCNNTELTVKESYLELNTNPKHKLIVLVNGFSTWVDIITYDSEIFQEAEVYLVQVLGYSFSEINWAETEEVTINFL